MCSKSCSNFQSGEFTVLKQKNSVLISSTEFQLVEKLDKLSQKCKYFFDKMQSVTRTRCARTLTA